MGLVSVETKKLYLVKVKVYKAKGKCKKPIF